VNGCVPVVLVAGAAGGYLTANKKASQKVSTFLGKISAKIKKLNKKGEVELYKYNLIITPQKISRGKEVTIKTVYGISGAPEKGIEVKERCTLYYKGEKLTVLDQETVTRKNGKWETKFKFRVPRRALKGQYLIRQEITTDSKKIWMEDTLEVI